MASTHQQHDARPHRPLGLLLPDVEGDQRPQPVDVERAGRGGPPRRRAAARGGRGRSRRPVPPLGRAHRGVDRVVGRHGHQATDVPPADVDVVGRVAVGAEQRRAVVRRQQHRTLEARRRCRAPTAPWSAPPRRARAPAAAPGAGCPAARHHASPAKPTASSAISLRVRAPSPTSTPSATARHGLGRRSKPRATSRASDDEQAGQRLRHHQRVVDPQVRVHRGDRRGDEADARPGAGAGRRARSRRSWRSRAAWWRSAATPTLPPLPRLHGVRYSEVSGPCSAPGRLGQPLPEPVALAVPAGLDAVVQRVVEQQRIVELDDEEVADPPRRPDRRDHGERSERSRSAGVAVTVAPASRRR